MDKIVNGIYDPEIYRMVYEYSLGVELNRVGHFSGLDSDILTPYKRDEYCKFLISLFLNTGKGGGQTPTAATIRELSQSLDMTDGNDRPIQSDLWRQEFDSSAAGMFNPNQAIYTIASTSGLHRKIILLYGVYIPTSFTNISEIQIWRKGMKLIDRLYTNGHKPGVKRLNTPIMLWTYQQQQREDNSHVEYEIKAKFEGGPTKTDNIRLLGYVAEAIGSSTMG